MVMIRPATTPAALAQRLAERTKRDRTVLIITDGDMIHEMQVGFGYRDALQALWEGEYAWPLRAVEFDLTRLAGEDVTAALAKDLSDRSFREGGTPKHLEPMLDAMGVPSLDADAPRRDPNAEHRQGVRELGLVR